jgi:hypothetical protein
MSFKISDDEYGRIFDDSKVSKEFKSGGYLDHSDLYNSIKYDPGAYTHLMQNGASWNGHSATSRAEHISDDYFDWGGRRSSEYGCSSSSSPKYRSLTSDEKRRIEEADKILLEKRQKEEEESRIRREEERKAMLIRMEERRKKEEEENRIRKEIEKAEFEKFCKELSEKLEEEHQFKIKKYAEVGLIDDPENPNTIKLVEYLLEKNGFDYVWTKLDEMGFYDTNDWFVEKYYDEYNDEKNELIDKEILDLSKILKHL